MTGGGTAGLIGLARRAGRLLVGTSGVRAGLRRDDVALVVVATDLSARTSDKVVRLAWARGVPVATGPGSAELGRLLGRSAVQAVGVTDEHLARGILADRAGRMAGGLRGDQDAGS